MLQDSLVQYHLTFALFCCHLIRLQAFLWNQHLFKPWKIRSKKL